MSDSLFENLRNSLYFVIHIKRIFSFITRPSLDMYTSSKKFWEALYFPIISLNIRLLCSNALSRCSWGRVC